MTARRIACDRGSSGPVGRSLRRAIRSPLLVRVVLALSVVEC